MPGELSDSPIQVYCTVKQDELQVTDSGLTCLRCAEPLQETEPGKTPPSSGCTFIRISRIPLIASSLALASCTDPITPPDPEPTPPIKKEIKENEKRPVLPGMISPPGQENKPIHKSDYPTAKRVVGRPKLIISPYNGKYIDVEGMPVGSLAMDPNFSPAEKKYFVIPPEVE